MIVGAQDAYSPLADTLNHGVDTSLIFRSSGNQQRDR